MDLLEIFSDMFIWLDLSAMLALVVCSVIGAVMYMGLMSIGVDQASALAAAVGLSAVMFAIHFLSRVFIKK